MDRPHAAQIRIVGTEFLRRRPLVAIPFAVANFAMFALGGASLQQLAVIAAGFSTLLVMFVAERQIAGETPLSEATLARSVVVTALGLAGACAITGGISGPVVPILLAPTGIGFAAFGRTRASAAILGTVIAAVAVLAWMGPMYPAPASPFREIDTGLAIVATSILLRLGVSALADAHAAAAAALGRIGEDAAGAARELEAVGAKVAHEVKNPLAAIRALVEVMQEAADPATRDAQRLAVVAGEVERIEGILRDYLEHHRPIAELVVNDVDIAVIVRDVAAVLEARADRARVALVVTAASLPARVDPRRLKQAVLNLALNALEAAAAGPRDGRVELACRGDGDSLAIEIADTGRGLAAAELARLGTPGYTTRDDGSGLGIAVARAVIAQHGGTLAFTSQPGRGTIASIRVPWQRS